MITSGDVDLSPGTHSLNDWDIFPTHYFATVDIAFPWWQLDFQVEYSIRGMKLFMRACCLDRMESVDIRVGNADASGTVSGETIV